VQQCMQLTSTNRPFGLTIKFTRCRYSCQLSAFSPQLKTELRREQSFPRPPESGRKRRNALTTVRRRKAEVLWLKSEVNKLGK